MDAEKKRQQLENDARAKILAAVSPVMAGKAQMHEAKQELITWWRGLSDEDKEQYREYMKEGVEHLYRISQALKSEVQALVSMS